MGPLKLFGLELGLRMALVGNELKETSASAYIYYQDSKHPKQPLEQDGAALATFTIKDRVKKLEDNVKNVIAPKIEAGLKNTPFTVIGVDYTNQVPQPHLVIARRDRDALHPEDLKELEQHLQAAIKAINKKATPLHMFTEANKAKQPTAPQHHYYFRHRP